MPYPPPLPSRIRNPQNLVGVTLYVCHTIIKWSKCVTEFYPHVRTVHYRTFPFILQGCRIEKLEISPNPL